MMCTPTRSSFQSGRLPIHVLTQLSSPCDKNGAIPRDMTGVAAQLKTAGYATHQGTLRMRLSYQQGPAARLRLAAAVRSRQVGLRQ